MDWNLEHLDPRKWDWKITNNQLMPFKIDMPSAPKDLLNILLDATVKQAILQRCTPVGGMTWSVPLHVENVKD